MGKAQIKLARLNEDWYDAICKSQMDNIVLRGGDRKKFNHAFDFLLLGSSKSAFQGFYELSEIGSSVSQYYIGLMYLKGVGVLQDFCMAHMWLNIAASSDHRKAVIKLESLTKKMTVEQIAEAQSLAREWRPLPPE